jgi:hypothetical protein
MPAIAMTAGAAEVGPPCGGEVAPLARRGLGRFAAEVGAAGAADSLFDKFFINFY